MIQFTRMKTVIYVSGTDKVQDRRRLFGLTEYAKRHGWNLQPVEALQSPQQAKELMRIWRPDGIIVCRGAALNALSARSFGKAPVLFSHNPGPRKTTRENCIFSDANAIVELAAKELLSLNLSAYAFVGWFKPIGWCTQRRSAFESFMQMHGRRIHVFEPSEHECSSNTITARLADWLSTLPHPLGVLTANDQIAQRIVSACHLARLAVPDDVAVIGIDNDDELCEGARPTISSIDPDFVASGRLAGEALDRLMSNSDSVPKHIMYPPLRLVRRESTRRFSRHDRDVARAVERIRKEACDGLTAGEVVKDFPCSRRMAELRFKEVTGRTAFEAILDTRMEYCLELLADPETPIGAIADRCGFPSALVMRRQFRSRLKMSPREWRNANSGSKP